MSARATRAIGVDIGGSGIKTGLVDLGAGELVGDRVRVPTPSPAVPEAVISATAEAVSELGAGEDLPVGVGLPVPFVDGRVMMAANIDDAWIGVDARRAFSDELSRPVEMLNDADAAALGEAAFGAAAGRDGTVLVLTFGTGIGSGLIHDGQLVPNVELGHIEMHGEAAERYAAASVRKREDLSWDEWAGRVTEYLAHVERVFRPDLIVMGGGVSNKPGKWLDKVETRPPLVAAAMGNRAGIVGAALQAVRVRV